MTSYELTHFKKMVRVWKTKSLLFCLRYDPLIVFRRQNHITFVFIKATSHDLLVQMAYWNLPFPTSGPSQFPQKIITLRSLSSIYYLQLPSKYLNKERSDQGEGSEILFTINYIILPTKKRKITYSLIFSRAFDVSLKPVFFLLLFYS